MLDVIIPAFNEENGIKIAVDKVSNILNENNIEFNILFIDDGSTDNTWHSICKVAEANEKVSAVRFSRNFGKEAAIFAGLDESQGNCAVVMDCDLQHPPEKIVEMYRLWEKGYEVVEGIKIDRGDETYGHDFAAKLFYKIIGKSTNMDLEGSSDYKLLDRKVIDTLNKMPEKNTFFRALSYWTGYNKTEISYAVEKRVTGTSKWSTWQLIKYSVRNITAFTSAPLHLVTILGIVMLIGGGYLEQ